MEIAKTTKLYLNTDTKKFIEDFYASLTRSKSLEADNERSIGSAWVYEKIRVAMEYQEEHLVFKNAVSRILRRHYALSLHRSAAQFTQDLISELSWANYLNPETLQPQLTGAIESAIGRCTVLLNSARSGRFMRRDLQKMIIDWLACEIDEIFHPDKENDILLNYTYSVLVKNVDIVDARITEKESESQLKVSIFSLLFKPDLPKIEFYLLGQLYPHWSKYDEAEIKSTGRSFDPFYNKIDRIINHPLRKKYLAYVKKNIAPFILMRRVLASQKIDISKISDNPVLFKNMVMDAYDSSVDEGRKKVWQGTFRALIFILLTKISLAFIIEIPFDRLLNGIVDYLSLTINISLPPLLMFIAGTFVKSPPKRNGRIVAQAVTEIISENKISGKTFGVAEKKVPGSYLVFNIFYSVFTLAILYGVIALLIFLRFNIVSIALFFFFVSVVSFFSFRIRNIALELAMKRTKDDALTSTVEFLLLPFIRIGKYISERFTIFNPFILALDFVIEAPFKTIIRIVNSWLRFVSAKKEELEY